MCLRQIAVADIVWYCTASGTLAANATHVYNILIGQDVPEDLAVVLTSHSGDADLCGPRTRFRNGSSAMMAFAGSIPVGEGCRRHHLPSALYRKS